MTTVEDRSWAAGLTQKEFEEQWMMKHPFADVIPDVSFYLVNQPKYAGIHGVNPEDFVEEGGKVDNKTGKVDNKTGNVDNKTGEKVDMDKLEKAGFICRGCKKEFKVKIAHFNHEKHCKAYLNTRT